MEGVEHLYSIIDTLWRSPTLICSNSHEVQSSRELCDACECPVQTAERENNPRGINRHKYSLEEAQEALQQPVVQALLDLCKFRNTHPAFNGKVGLAAASACLAPRASPLSSLTTGT